MPESMPTAVNPATRAASIAPRPPGVGAAAAITDAPRYTAPTWPKLTSLENAAIAAASAPMYAIVTPNDPPNNSARRDGERAMPTTLDQERCTNPTTYFLARRLPRRVATRMPATAKAIARPARTLLPAGRWKPLAL